MRVASKFLMWLLVPALTGCAHGRFQLADSSNSGASSDGSNGSSDGSKGSGDSSKDSGDSSKDSGDSSKDSGKSNSDNSSESRSETSGTVTTKGDEAEPDTTNAGALLLLSGIVLLGATVVGAYFLFRRDEPHIQMVQQQREIRLALARGEGPFVRDVGSRLGVSQDELPALAEVLRRGRARLEPDLAVAEITPAVGEHFAQTLAEILREDARFRGYVERLMERVRDMPVRGAGG